MADVLAAVPMDAATIANNKAAMREHLGNRVVLLRWYAVWSLVMVVG